jgi:hypothetical protein
MGAALIMKKIICILSILSIFHLGCASKSKDIQATYVSPLQYQHYDCVQIGQELNRVRMKLSEIAASQDQAANKDAAAMAIGMVVFWPALFFLIGGDKKEELARLKGEYEALEKLAIEKNCHDVLTDIGAYRKHQAEIEKSQKSEETEKSEEEALRR